jgi:hypothetical protein
MSEPLVSTFRMRKSASQPAIRDAQKSALKYVSLQIASPNGSEYLLQTSLVLRESTSLPRNVGKIAASENLLENRAPARRRKPQREEKASWRQRCSLGAFSGGRAECEMPRNDASLL